MKIIFGLFNSLDQNIDGTGVGLTLVKRIVKVHRGRVWIESVGGEQAPRFVLRFLISWIENISGSL